MVEVRMRNEHDIHRREVAQVQAGLAQSLQNEQPARKVRVDDDIHSSHLEEEAGMADEGDAQLAAFNELRLVRASGTRCDGGMTDEAGKAAGSLAKCRIF